MSKKSYRQTLQHPRWQKKRLEILTRSDWRCQWCGSTEVNLQVHHGYYAKSYQPWDYEEQTLYCLCDHCHERAETVREALYREVAKLHPKHHSHVCTLLRELQRLVEQDERLLIQAHVERS
jgi:5-methylcytosine-specific restriction endonuclease McrA